MADNLNSPVGDEAMKTAAMTGVASSAADLFDFEKNRIGIAID